MIRLEHENPAQIKFNQIITELGRYFIDIPTKCPYGLPGVAVFRQAMFERLPDEIAGFFFKAGFRRSGNSFYTMVCPDCKACAPIRLLPQEFKPNRNQKRVVKLNADVVTETANLNFSSENLAACDKFLHSRYPAKNDSAEEYYSGFFINTVTNTIEIRYRVNGKLLGTAIVDVGARWLNAVYFFFDPEEGKRSPGTLNILHLINFCREKNIPNLYLGYLIDEVKSMRYKANFKPYYLLMDGVWIKEERKTNREDKARKV